MLRDDRGKKRRLYHKTCFMKLSVDNLINSPHWSSSNFCCLLSAESTWLVSSFSYVLASSAIATGDEPSGLCAVVKVFHQLDNAPRACDRAPPVHITELCHYTHTLYDFKYLIPPHRRCWDKENKVKNIRLSFTFN